MTTIRIFNRNTGKVIEAVVQTPGGVVTYDGDARVDGVPGTGAPIVLNFLDAAGAKTGKLLPTGHVGDRRRRRRRVVRRSVIAARVCARNRPRARQATRSKRELDADPDLIARIESIRRKAALLMGMGDVAGKVLPKFALVAPPGDDGTLAGTVLRAVELPLGVRRHRRAVPGCCSTHSGIGSAYGVARQDEPGVVVIEHPAGSLETRMSTRKRRRFQHPDVRARRHRAHGASAARGCRSHQRRCLGRKCCAGLRRE